MHWPYLVLDVPENASDEKIRKAYQRKVRECPPERDAEAFSAVQQAYEHLKNAENRARIKLFGLSDFPDTLAELVPDLPQRRKIIPMHQWLKEFDA